LAIAPSSELSLVFARGLVSRQVQQEIRERLVHLLPERMLMNSRVAEILGLFLPAFGEQLPEDRKYSPRLVVVRVRPSGPERVSLS